MNTQRICIAMVKPKFCILVLCRFGHRKSFQSEVEAELAFTFVDISFPFDAIN
jgi:hypothetical protein